MSSYTDFQGVTQDLDSIYNDYLHLREMITKQLTGLPADSEQAKFLRSELEIVNHKLGELQHLHKIYLDRCSIFLASWSDLKLKLG